MPLAAAGVAGFLRGGSGVHILRGWRWDYGLTREVSTFFIVPGEFVVNLLLGIESGKKAVFREIKSVFDNKGGVGVVDEIVFRDAAVGYGVVDDAAEEGDVGTGTNLYIQIGVRRGAGEARIYDDGLGVAMNFGFYRPFEDAGVILGGIAAHDQHHLSILDVDPAVGHRAASECGPQTGDRWAVSNASLVFQVADPQAAHTLDGGIIKFVSIGAAAGEGYAFAAVDGFAIGVLLDECVVARLLHLLRDFFVGLIPGDVLPVGASGTADLGLEQAAVVENVLLERGAFGAKCAAIDRMVRIALDVENLRD